MKTSYRFCVNCGRRLKSGDQDCPVCRGDKDLYCPACGMDVQREDLRCSYCGIAFFGNTEKLEKAARQRQARREKQNELVCAQTFLNRFEADLARGLLESFGIWSLIKADDLGGMRAHLLYLVPARLYVRRADVRKAEQILAAPK